MELHELVERIERWKKRQAGVEDNEPIPVRPKPADPVKMVVPMAVVSYPSSPMAEPPQDRGEVTDEFELEPVTGAGMVEPVPGQQASSMDYPGEGSLASLLDDVEVDDDVSGIVLSELEEEK